ncbi:MAG TPA: hypothetical protein VG815_07460 [Chloroflexota bacterium]|jgi:hypothetical protein|nr:hypothetical protein [Chloroflexota bacterium]
MRQSYSQTNNFDVKVGMTVYTAIGDKVGTVVNVAGFGTTRVLDGLQDSESGYTTQASGGTGHFGVKPSGGPSGESATPMYKFSDIDKVVEDHGLILLAAVTDKATRKDQDVPKLSPSVDGGGLRQWSSWLRRGHRVGAG